MLILLAPFVSWEGLPVPSPWAEGGQARNERFIRHFRDAPGKQAAFNGPPHLYAGRLGCRGSTRSAATESEENRPREPGKRPRSVASDEGANLIKRASMQGYSRPNSPPEFPDEPNERSRLGIESAPRVEHRACRTEVCLARRMRLEFSLVVERIETAYYTR